MPIQPLRRSVCVRTDWNRSYPDIVTLGVTASMVSKTSPFSTFLDLFDDWFVSKYACKCGAVTKTRTALCELKDSGFRISQVNK